LTPKLTAKRAPGPGPGPITRRDWASIAAKHLSNRQVILHTDGARAYKLKLSGVIHDNVVHKKERVIIKGKAEWIKPRYTKIYKDKLPDGKHVVAKAGAQISRSLLRSFETKSEAHLPKARERFVAKKLARPLRQWKMWSSNLKMIFGHICDKDCADFHRFHVAKGCQ